MTTTLDILRQARDLLSDESRWTQGAYAATAKGGGYHAVDIESPEAKCFCSMGALLLASKHESGTAAHCAREELECTIGELTPNELPRLVRFNDSRTHSEVLDLFDRTIQRLEQGEKQCTSSTVLNSES